MEIQKGSIFRRYFSEEPFEDRFLKDSRHSVDVLIPIIHTNECWKSNLLSIFREIPVNRLLIGDGGCKDDSLTIVKEFPRVVICDHRNFKSLGFSIRKLVEEVKTDWFIYLHSDVFLPDGWFDSMYIHQKKYDWFECEQNITVMVEYLREFKKSTRGFGFGGSHMGRRAAFEKALPHIEDDYLYRNEDIIIRTLVQNQGFKWGIVEDVFHYHQEMFKASSSGRRLKSVNYQLEMNPKEEIRMNSMQAKGFIKYLNPFPVIIDEMQICIGRLLELNELDWNDFIKWVEETNPNWLPYLKKRVFLLKKFKSFIRRLGRWVFS
jgi:uncharacterized protein Smg (DUF494 family)